MDVSNVAQVFGSMLGPTVSAPTSSSPTAASASTPSSSTSGNLSAQARAILSGYDMQDISPSQFSSLVQSLQEAGALAPNDLRDLSQIRSELDSSGADPNEPLDLVKFLSDKLAAQKKQLATAVNNSPGGAAGVNADAYTGQVQRQLGWIQKFAAMQGSSASDAVDALA